MSTPDTERLVQELSRDLEPVRPIPRLRSVVALALFAVLAVSRWRRETS